MDDQNPALGDAPASWGDPRSRTVTWHDPLALAQQGTAMSGLEYLQAMIDGVLPPPPIANLLQMWLTEAAPGRATFRCDPDESVYNPIGVIHGGLVCTMLDSAVGCAVQTTLPQGIGYASAEIKVNYLRPVHPGGGPLTATGTVVKPGRRIAFAEGVVTDKDGTPVATGTSTLLVIPLATPDSIPR
jgi:uncharacterized protein (TIGR00369 family)